MPSLSLRQAALRHCFSKWNESLQRVELLEEAGCMEDAEAVEDESRHWLIKYLSVSSKRYHRKRKKHRRSTLLPMFINECNLVLQEDGGTCSEVDFKQYFGMFRESFWKLHSRIKNHSVFSTKKGTKQIPSQFQLLVCLNWLRTEGDGESSHKGRRGWKCSVGNLDNCRKRYYVCVHTA